MRYSNMYIPTVKDVVPDSEALNYRLLYKAGYLRKSSAGVFILLPMGKRAIDRLKQQISVLLEQAGLFEIALPLKQERESLFKVLTAAKLSYKELPAGLWYGGEKTAEGIRPRLGLLQPKTWESLTGYKLSDGEEIHMQSQEALSALSRTLLQKLHLDFVEGERLSEDCGGEWDRVFFLPYSSGSEKMLHCSHCGTYVAASSMACGIREKATNETAAAELIHTPQVKSITDLAEHLKITSQDIIKTLIYKADDKLYGVLLRGDRELSEAKLRKALGCYQLRAANEGEVFEATQAEVGFAGPLGLKAELLCDYEAAAMTAAVVGANKTDYHYGNIVPGRDFEIGRTADLRTAAEADCCPTCGGTVAAVEGFELAVIKSFGSGLAQNSKLTFTGRDGRPANPYMLCIEFNLTRLMAATAEKNHDKDGLILPSSVAPFDIIIMPVHQDNELQQQKAEELYCQLKNMGFRVLLDDRPERVSIKFKDSELLGIPLRITLGRKAEEGIAEVKYRGKELQELPIDTLMTALKRNGEIEC